MRRKKRKQRCSTKEISKAIISVVAAVGVVSFAIALPNAMLALAALGAFKRSSYAQKKYVIKNKLYALERKGFIRLEQQGRRVRITPEGRAFLARCALDGYVIRKDGAWDGQWRIVSFDIPCHASRTRNELRAVFKKLGFVYLHQSLWATPYPCDGLVDRIKEAFGLNDELLYMTAMRISNERALERKFHLR